MFSKLHDCLQVYWILGDSDKIPDSWPQNLSTNFNMQTPMNLTLHNDTFLFYASVSAAIYLKKSKYFNRKLFIFKKRF